MFKLEKLPKDVREKIHDIDFTPDEDNVMGFVNLKDEYEFEHDGSHVEGFESRNDLIDLVRNYAKKVR